MLGVAVDGEGDLERDRWHSFARSSIKRSLKTDAFDLAGDSNPADDADEALEDDSNDGGGEE